MTVEQRRIIDVFSTHKDGEHVILTISDHLEWDAGNHHILVLQEKLNDYMSFIASGELYEKYPQAKDKNIGIQVVCKFEPDGNGLRFMESARQKIEETGVQFSYIVVTHEQAEQGSGADG